MCSKSHFSKKLKTVGLQRPPLLYGLCPFSIRIAANVFYISHDTLFYLMRKLTKTLCPSAAAPASQSNFRTSVAHQSNRLPTSGQVLTVSFSPADHRVHVLRDHAEQVGAADLPTRLHEEPPGLPSRPSGAGLAFLQLHVHARRVRTAASTHSYMQTLSHTHARCLQTPEPSNSFSPPVACPHSAWSSWASTPCCS